jgi:serine/threonine protein kinase
LSSSDDDDDDEDDTMMMMDDDTVQDPPANRAYWLQRTIRDAIYGRVVSAVVLVECPSQTFSNHSNHHPLHRPTTTNSTQHPAQADWQVTTQMVAVKEMSWQHIRRERERLAEDPITEVAAMQYLMDLHNTSNSGTNAIEDGGAASSSTTATSYNGSKKDTLSAVLETNIMMPVDLLSDDRHLYSIMPYCNGGELFERLDKSERFTEAEARYWMAQILNVRS